MNDCGRGSVFELFLYNSVFRLGKLLPRHFFLLFLLISVAVLVFLFQKYLTTLRKEKEAFEVLIKNKGVSSCFFFRGCFSFTSDWLRKCR